MAVIRHLAAGSDFHPKRTSAGLFTLTVFILSALGCGLNPNYRYVTRDNSTTKLVTESSEVRRLLAEGRTQDEKRELQLREGTHDQQVQHVEDIELHPDLYMVERRKLLSAMGRQPGVLVTGKQYFRVIEQSSVLCANDPITTGAEYVKVQVSTGPAKGIVGWACSADVQPTGDWVL